MFGGGDDFESYPMPKRETNWTLKNESRKRQPGQSAVTGEKLPPRPMNRTDDILGAKTGSTALYRATQYTNKPVSNYTTSDISGATPKRQIPDANASINKPNDRHIHNHDIEHSYPESKLFSTPRTVDPLNPHYKLPAVNKRAPTPPTQKTETLKIRDIEGTKPKPLWRRSEVRNPLDYSDIPFSHAGSREELRKRKTESKMLVTADINFAQDEHRRMTNRHVSPLDPQYTLPGNAPGKTETIGGIMGSQPRKMPPQRQDKPMLSLVSGDIDGCKPGNSLPYPKQGRREWKKTCDVSDIDTKGRRKF